MNGAIAAVDALGLVAFVIALAVTLRIPLSSQGAVNAVGKTCMALAMGVYVFAMSSNLLEHTDITSMLDPVEDYGEILFPVFIAYAMYAMFVRRRELELLASQRAAMRSQEMVLGIMDSTPAGIMVLDPVGRITFANEAAKTILDLSESGCGVLTTPGWLVSVDSHDPVPDFSALVTGEFGGDGIPVAIEWPKGWRVELTVRIEVLSNDVGGIGGLVATFLPPSGLHPAAVGS